MKKTYSTPCVHAIKLQPQQMLAASNGKIIDIVSDVTVDGDNALSEKSSWDSSNWSEEDY